MKRTERAGPAKPPRTKQQTPPEWPAERHSGEGSASALETLQRLTESRQQLAQPPATPSTDASPSEPE